MFEAGSPDESWREWMEKVDEFQERLCGLLRNAKDELQMTDATIAYVLLREGTSRYFASITKTAAGVGGEVEENA